MPVLFICVIIGAVCAMIGSSKGRNPVGWFFIGFFLGLIGLVIALVVPNLKEQTAYRQSVEQENRRLREQVRQEQMKAEAFRMHTQNRLDAHDQKLGIDTRVNDRVFGDSQIAGLLHSADAPVAQANAVPPPASQPAAPPPSTAGWYYSVDGQSYGPVASAQVVHLIQESTITKSALVWTEGMPDWAAADSLPEFNARVTS